MTKHILLLVGLAACSSAPELEAFELEVSASESFAGMEVEVAGQKLTLVGPTDEDRKRGRTSEARARHTFPATTPALDGSPVTMTMKTPCGDRKVTGTLKASSESFDREHGTVNAWLPELAKPTRTTVYFDAPHARSISIGALTFSAPFPRSADIFDMTCGSFTTTVDGRAAATSESPLFERHASSRTTPSYQWVVETPALLITDDPARCYREGLFAYGSERPSNTQLTGALVYRLSLFDYETVLEPLPREISVRSGQHGGLLSALYATPCR